MLSFVLITVAIAIMLVTKSTTGITSAKILLFIEGMATFAYDLVYKDLKKVRARKRNSFRGNSLALFPILGILIL